MNRLNLIFIIFGISVAVVTIFALMDGINASNRANEEHKLNGESSIFQYCSHIGKAAIYEPRCKEFNLLYGPRG
jgi:hypothetical protein